jgi:transcription elongation factor GreB
VVKVTRPQVVDEVAAAAAMGDRSENAEYIYGKKRLREIDRRLRFLNQRLDAAVVVDPQRAARKDKVYFGATVTVEDDANGSLATWQLIGEDEIDAGNGKISHKSPMGLALLGKMVGDEVTVRAPGGKRLLVVVAIAYG